LIGFIGIHTESSTGTFKLTCCAVNFSTILGSQLMSIFLDWKRITVKKRVLWGFYYVVFLHLVAWIYAWVIQEKYTRENPVFDWVDKGFVEGFFVLALWGELFSVNHCCAPADYFAEFSRQSLQNWMYYMVSVTTDNISQLSQSRNSGGYWTSINKISSTLRYTSRPRELFTSSVIWY